MVTGETISPFHTLHSSIDTLTVKRTPSKCRSVRVCQVRMLQVEECKLKKETIPPVRK